MADPTRQLARTYSFLGLKPFAPEGIEKRVNATARSAELNEDVRRRLVQLYSPDVLALSKCFPDLDIGLWPNFNGISVE
jgi:hypothetical protein